MEEVAAQVDALRSGTKTADEVRQDEEARERGYKPQEAPTVGIWKEPEVASPMPNPETKKGGVEVPLYSMEPSDNGLTVSIQLPNVASVSEIDMEVTRTTLELEVPDLYKLKVRLPQAVDEDEVSAKWVKQERKLVLTCGLE